MLNFTYLELKNNIRRKPESPAALIEMKVIFREDIKSKRTEDRIRTVSDLIEVLEKRDVLNKDNIDPLRRIDAILNTFFLHYSEYNAASSKAVPQTSNGSNNYYNRSSRIQYDPIVKAKVYEVIASEIGMHWESFARNLSMPESRIDDLQQKSTKNKIYEILHFHEDECDTRKWRTGLLKALIQCRRKDLYERVQLIFDTFNT